MFSIKEKYRVSALLGIQQAAFVIFEIKLHLSYFESRAWEFLVYTALFNKTERSLETYGIEVSTLSSAVNIRKAFLVSVSPPVQFEGVKILFTLHARYLNNTFLSGWGAVNNVCTV